MTTFEEWKARGQRLPMRLSGREFRIWALRQGARPSLTLLHGFPTSSHDWAETMGLLSGVDMLTFDFLGFGDSDKPADHSYSIHEQADLTEAMWARHFVSRTFLAVHDYAVSVAEELLARHLEGKLKVDLLGALFLNGGVYPDLHRALPGQLMLLDPERGKQIGEMVTEEAFTSSLLVTFPPDRPPPPAVLHEMWNSVVNRDGQRIGYRLINYINDRKKHASRWTGALEKTEVPRRFVWGMLDPVSGGHVVPRLRERLPDCPIRCLDDVGHWPSIEAPQNVAEEIRALVNKD